MRYSHPSEVHLYPSSPQPGAWRTLKHHCVVREHTLVFPSLGTKPAPQRDRAALFVSYFVFLIWLIHKTMTFNSGINMMVQAFTPGPSKVHKFPIMSWVWRSSFLDKTQRGQCTNGNAALVRARKRWDPCVLVPPACGHAVTCRQHQPPPELRAGLYEAIQYKGG